MGKVIKKGGKKQAFSASKIRKSILDATKDAKYSPAKAKNLVKEVGDAVIRQYRGKRLVKSIVLRRSILGRLDTRVKSVANAWRRYDRKKR